MHLAESFAKERDRFPLWVPVLLGVGIGLYFVWPTEPPHWIAPLKVLFCGTLAYIFRQRLGWRVLFTAAMLLNVGFAAAGFRTDLVAAPVLDDTLYYRSVEGRIDDIQNREKGERLILTQPQVEGLAPDKTPQRLSVTLKKDAPSLAVGDKVRLKTTLFPPPVPVMPGAFDFARQFYYDRLGAVGFSPGGGVEVIEKAPARSFEEWLNNVRLSLNARIVAPMVPENGPVAAAMMVGEQTAVSQDISDAMRDAGIYHVLSISGLHMTLAVGLLYVTVRLLLSLYPPLGLRLPVKKIAAAIGLLGALAYLLLAGSPVPAVRSFVMVACVMLAVLFDRHGISLYSLAWAATLILLFQPEAIFGASFQLSFAATLAIIAFYEHFGEILYRPDTSVLRRLWLYFLGLMLTSLVATLATTPLVIYQFNRFSFWGIAANMLTVPLASFWIMPAAVLAFLAMPMGLEYWPLIWLDRGISLMVAGSRWFASLPYASLAVPPPTFSGIMLVVFGGLWLCLWRQRWRLIGVPLMLLGMATILLHKPYDLLVSDDASKVAWRTEKGFLFLRGKPTSFDGEIWLRYHGQEEGLALSDVDDDLCDKERCTFETHGKRVVVAKRKNATSLCERADIVIAASTLDEDSCDRVPVLIDGVFLRTHGATAIRFEGGVQVETANAKRGQRPWNPVPHSPLYPPDNPDITIP